MNSDFFLLSSKLIQSIADWIFMPYVVAVLLGGGLFLTLRLGIVQVRRFPEALRAMFARSPEQTPGILSPFQAFATALAASIGTAVTVGLSTRPPTS